MTIFPRHPTAASAQTAFSGVHPLLAPAPRVPNTLSFQRGRVPWAATRHAARPRPRPRPRGRPSASMRPPPGPHVVGVHDARLPDAAGGHRVRLFYPAAPGAASAPPRWLPASARGLVDETALGVLRFIRAPAAPLLALLATPLARVRLEHARADAAPAPPPPGSRGWPLALFSHGLGGSLAAYTLLCMDAASYGRVVVAVEHHDGSAVVAFKGAAREEIPYRRYDAAADGTEWAFRNGMLETRLDDLDAALGALRAAAAPAGAPLEPLTAASPTALEQAAVAWTSALDFDDVQVVGHSFGGATAVGWALRHGGAPWLRRVLALDAWLFSLDKQVVCNRDKCEIPADLPMLFVDCDFGGLKQSRGTLRSACRQLSLNQPVSSGCQAQRGALITSLGL